LILTCVARSASGTFGAVRTPPTPVSARHPLGRTVIALGAVSFFTDVSSEMIYPLLPVFLGTVLGASATSIGVIEGMAESVAALLKFASGWWSDRVRRRKPLVVLGYAIASLVRPLVGIAQSASQVLAVRVTDRIGKGIRTSPRDALIADSVDPRVRGKAFGFHRASDHAGAVFGPLIAFVLLERAGVPMRTLFLLAAIPGIISVVVLVLGVREAPAQPDTTAQAAANVPVLEPARLRTLGRRFWAVLGAILIFTLGNSTDAFLLLRAADLGVPIAQIPLLWALLHVVKSASSTPGGALSDRVGRRPLLIAGWLLFAAVYFAFGRATAAWHAWVLFAIYGVYFGLTEGTEKALVADLVPASARGTAFGGFNLAISLGALPASVIFGLWWDRSGPRAAFDFGAAMALLATIALVLVLPRVRRDRAPVVTQS
jgi:MFS family permease